MISKECNMPYKTKGKCVYKKDTGKKVGCTKGSVKKYLAALHINAHEESNKKMSITQKDVLKGIRKDMPPPTKPFKDKKKYDRKNFKNFKSFYEMEIGTLASAGRNVGDFSHVAEAMYAAGQEYSIPAVQPLVDNVDKEQLIKDVIFDLEDLKTSHDWSKPLDNDLIRAMADTLKDAGIEPTDFYAAVDASPEKQEEYLLYGPSSWKGGKGALNDLKAILRGNEPEEISDEEETLTPEDIHTLADEKNIVWDNDPNFMKLTQELTGKKHLDDLNQKELRIMKDYLTGLEEDESNPAADLPMGSTSAGDPLSEGVYRIGEVILDNPYGTGRKHFKGIDRIEAKSDKHALAKFINILATREKIPTNPRILYRNAQANKVQITRLPDPTPPKEPKYWWQDRD